MDKSCIITGEKLTPENDSKAHVMPSALGWRFKPKGIVSRNGNTEIGDKIDLPMITSFQPIATMLNVSRDRGANQPITVTDEKGRGYVVAFAEPLKLVKPDYLSEPAADGGRSIRIEARTMKELRQLLGRAAKEIPELDIDEALAHAVKAQEWPEGMLHSEVQIGPASVWPSLFVGASIFAASQGCDVHPGLGKYVKAFDPDEPELPPDTFYFAPEVPWLAKGDAISHVVVLITDAARQRSLVYLEAFSTIGVGVVLPYSGSEEKTAVESVDVLSGARVEVAVDAARVRALDWVATHKLSDTSFMKLQERAITRLIETGQRLASEAAHAAASNHIGSSGNLVEMIERLVDHTILMCERPGLSVADLEANQQGFENVCREFKAKLPFGRRYLFAAAIAPSRRKLMDAIEKLKGTRR